MRKQIPAILAAFFITAVIALAMAVVGVNALVNPNTVAVSDMPAALTTDATVASADQGTVPQLQAIIQQYQQREQQYQQQIQQDQQQLQLASTQMQQVQQLLMTLQDRGLITIDQNGQITILGRRRN